MDDFETLVRQLPLERLSALLAQQATITPRTLLGAPEPLALDKTATMQAAPATPTAPQLASSHPSLPTLRLLASGQPALAGDAHSAASLADLEIVGELGEGGMGRVLRARQRALEREVALKLLRPELAQLASPVETLLQEARLTGLLEHPNIIPVHLLGHTERDGPALVMKRVEGVSWRALLRDPDHPFWADERVSPQDRLAFHLEVCLKVCDAVAFAHHQRIIHRDIKPDNVMVGRFGEVYLMDWGIALRLDEDTRAQEQNRFGDAPIVGTPAYMAPEMVVGRLDQLTIKTDIFLLGATLYEALSGQVPYHAPEPYQLLFMAYQGRWAPLPDTLDAELTQIVARAMAPAQADRWPDVEALQAALRGYLTHRGSIQTTSRAEAIMEQASALPSGDEARHALWTEAQLMLRIALEQWPQSQRALDGLQRCVGALIRDAIDQRELGAARRLLNALPRPDEALSQEIDRLQAEQDAAAERAAQLARDADISEGAQSRARFFVALIAMPLVLFTAALVLLQERSDLTSALTIKFILAADLIGLAAVALFWPRLRATRINRQLVWVLSWSLALMTLNRLTAHAAQTPLPDLFRADLLLLTGVVGTGMWVLHRAVLLPALIGLAGACAVTLYPERAFLIFALATCLLTAATALVLTLLGKRAAPLA